MQELKVATVNRVSFEKGDLQQWIRNYDDVSKDYFLRLFNIVFECNVDFLTDGSGAAIVSNRLPAYQALCFRDGQ